MLVKISGKKNEEVLVVSSRDIAENFEKQHSEVLKRIQGYDRNGEHINGLLDEIGSSVNTLQYFIPSQYKDASGKNNIEYFLPRDGFSLLVMGFTGPKALEWKLKYIQAFNEMETELKRLYEERKQWEIERAKGVLVRHILTDTIKLKIADSPHKKFAYPNYTKLIYKTIFGKPLKELQKEFGVKSRETIRDYLNAEQLKEVEAMEMLISSLINIGWGYEQIKNFIQEHYAKKLAS